MKNITRLNEVQLTAVNNWLTKLKTTMSVPVGLGKGQNTFKK